MLGIPEVIVPPVPRHHVGDGPADDRPQIRHDPNPVSGQRQRRSQPAQRRPLRRWSGAWRRSSPPTISTPTSVSFVRDGDLRYVGQGYELKIPFPAGNVADADLAEIWERFHQAHKREYGHFFRNNPIEIVNIRVTGVGAMPKIQTLKRAERRLAWRRRGSRTGSCVFRVGGELQSVRHDVLSPPPVAGRRTIPRARHRPAKGQYDRHSAGLVGDQRRRRQPDPQIRRRLRDGTLRRLEPSRSAGDAGRPDHRRRDPGRSGEHRHRDGPQTDADELLEHHPRVRGLRRGADRRGGQPALRVQDEHAAAVGPDSRLCPRDQASVSRRAERYSGPATSSCTTTPTAARRTAPTSRSACRCSTARRCSASRSRPRTISTSARIRRAAAASSTRSTPMPKGLQFKAHQGGRPGQAQRHGLAHDPRQHPNLGSGGRRYGGADRGRADRRAALPRSRAPLWTRHRRGRERGL